MPRNIVIASTTIVTIVAAAFLDSGGRNAGTPFDTASTPVIAVQPFEKAVSSRNSVSDFAVRGDRIGGDSPARPRPSTTRHTPTRDQRENGRR